MKKIWIALSFALFAPACMTPLPQDSAAESSQTSVAASSLTANPRVDAACLAACEDAFETCASGAQDNFTLCECGNSQVACNRRCGQFGVFHQCF